jgi:hypothetical protein
MQFRSSYDYLSDTNLMIISRKINSTRKRQHLSCQEIKIIINSASRNINYSMQLHQTPLSDIYNTGVPLFVYLANISNMSQHSQIREIAKWPVKNSFKKSTIQTQLWFSILKISPRALLGPLSRCLCASQSLRAIQITVATA